MGCDERKEVQRERGGVGRERKGKCRNAGLPNFSLTPHNKTSRHPPDGLSANARRGPVKPCEMDKRVTLEKGWKLSTIASIQSGDNSGQYCSDAVPKRGGKGGPSMADLVRPRKKTAVLATHSLCGGVLGE